MNQYIEKSKIDFEKCVHFFHQDIASLRTGRVAPSLVEQVKVEAYETVSDLMHIASISAPEPQTIVIKPWDKGILKNIERAIQNSDLNVNPVVESELVRLNFPPLTEETRKEMVKQLHKKLEEARIAVRGVRDKVKDEINTAEKNKQMSEDEKFSGLEALDEATKSYNEKLKEESDKKEKEIMTI